MNPFLWHGLAMAVAWLVLLPAGALVARFFKVRRRQDFPYSLDSQFWWNAHRIVQVSATLLIALAAWIAWDALDQDIDWPALHVRIGVPALGLLGLQLLSPIFRGTKGGPTDDHADPFDPETWRGDHFDMTLRRRAFELVHKGLGYACMGLAVLACWTGIDSAGLDWWWKGLVALAVAAFAGLFAYYTATRTRVGTWQAIWGPYGR